MQLCKNIKIMEIQKKLGEIESDKLIVKFKYVVCQSKAVKYNPIHVHTGCKVSAIAYLRTPKHQINDKKKHFGTDGMVSFTNNSGNDFVGQIQLVI